MDVLSEVLRAVRLTGAVYFELSAADPWISMRMPHVEHVIPFHVMIAGRAWVMPKDGALAPTLVEAGDIIMFPRGESHIITSDPDVWHAPTANLMLYRDAGRGQAPFTLRIGGSGQKTKLACGYLGCDVRPFNPLLGVLPNMLIIKKQKNLAGLMKKLLRVALDEREAKKAGGETMLAKLSELMFAQAMRWHIDSLSDGATDWVAGLRDPYVGKALHLIHSRPSDDWSLERLAKEVGMSRSVFAERFTRYAGEPPMHYVGLWRMQLASNLLSAGHSSIGEVAERVGYRSEAAFKRAFKKYVGMTPGNWKKRNRLL